jgi:hypothetical protein
MLNLELNSGLLNFYRGIKEESAVMCQILLGIMRMLMDSSIQVLYALLTGTNLKFLILELEGHLSLDRIIVIIKIGKNEDNDVISSLL